MSNLFSPITIKNIKFKNRIIMAPMVCFGYTKEDDLVTEKNIAHYEARARGGVGAIIVEATCVSQNGRLSPTQLGLWSDEFIDGFRKIAQACHQYGAKVLVQIHSAGLMAPKSVTGDTVAPSEYTGKSRFGITISARALSLDEIQKIQDDFAAAAFRAKEAGLDGIELHGAHGYLISQFFSPQINHRSDLYGGNLANRTRFATEIISKVRKAVGNNFIIGCRMGCNEPDLETSIEIAKKLEAAGLDLLHISTGMETNPVTTKEGPFPIPPNFNYNWVVFGGTEIKRNVHVPVIVVNGIRTPEQADNLIENNLTDFVALGKGLLVDSEWANKAQNTRDVSTCIDCKVCAYFRPGATCPKLVVKTAKAEN